MSAFDQRGQRVTHQVNIEGGVHFDSATSRVDVADELRKLVDAVQQAHSEGILDAEVAEDVQHELNQAVRAVQRPGTEGPAVVSRLTRAREHMANIAAAAGLAAALGQAIGTVQALF
ncbi:hypothetical protein AB0C11_33435 [Streptomyces sp. NPDC039016]|uniref:hypothetical protein n=1 Tax=Streptomyces sp. NPDC039016 TaxID=3154330 RepID=UPI003410F693